MKPDDLVLITEPNTVFQLTWCINNICTNHCRYCPDMLHRGQNKHYDWDDAARFSRAVLERHSKIQLTISGGEPTVSPWLKDLINLYADQGQIVGLTTNGVRPGYYWDNARPSYICISYHAAFDDGQWFERTRDTGQRIANTSVRIMMDPERWDQCCDMYQKIWDLTDLGVEAVRIVDWGAQPINYTEQQLDLLANMPSRASPGPVIRSQLAQAVTFNGQSQPAGGMWANKLAAQNKNIFTGWSCSIGLNSLFVQFDGSYRRGNCEQGGYIGWIQDPTLQWPTEPVICGVPSCHCTTDILIPKKRVIPVQPAAKPRRGS